jgi:transglutaminase-like putative cysteine protease
LLRSIEHAVGAPNLCFLQMLPLSRLLRQSIRKKRECAAPTILLLFLCTSLYAAEFEILDKQDTFQIQSTSFASEHHRQTVKILTDEGAGYKEYLAVNGYIQIKNLDVTITSTDGHSRKLKKEDIYEVPVSDSPDTVTDYKAIIVAPADLKPGDSVQLEYDRAVTSLLYLDPWVYATSVPVKKASCSISFSSAIPIKYRGQDPTVKIEQSENAGTTTITMATSNQQEVFLSGKFESFGQVERKVVWMPDHCMTEKWELSTKSWQDVARWFSDLTRFAYHEDPEMDAVVAQIKQNAKTPEEIAQGIYEYVQKNFTYTAIEIGIGGYKPRFAAQTFQKKYGDCKDLTFLLITLLKKAGVEAYPALVDTRHAKFFYRDFPSPGQFNHCIAYLPKLKNGIWVDSTVKNFRLGEVPSVIQGKYALVAGGPDDLIQIPEDFYNSNVLRFEFTGTYKEPELNITGNVHMLGQSSAYVDAMRNALLRNAVKNYVYSKLLKPTLPILQLQTQHSGDRTLELTYTTPVEVLDPYRILLINAVSYPPLENLAIDPRENEFFALGTPVRVVVDCTIEISGHSLLSPASTKEQKGKYVSYKVELKEDQGKLHYLADVYFANGFLDNTEMKKYKEELQSFATVLQRTVVMR